MINAAYTHHTANPKVQLPKQNRIRSEEPGTVCVALGPGIKDLAETLETLNGALT